MIHVCLYWDVVTEGSGPVYLLCGFIGEIEEFDDGTLRHDPIDFDFIGDGGVVTAEQFAKVSCEGCRALADIKATARVPETVSA